MFISLWAPHKKQCSRLLHTITFGTYPDGTDWHPKSHMVANEDQMYEPFSTLEFEGQWGQKVWMLQNWECSPVNCDLLISTQLHSLRIHNATLQNAKKGEVQNVVVSNLHCQSKQFKDMLGSRIPQSFQHMMCLLLQPRNWICFLNLINPTNCQQRHHLHFSSKCRSQEFWHRAFQKCRKCWKSGKKKTHTFKANFSSSRGDSRLCSAIAATCWCCCNKHAPHSSFQKLLGLASPPPKASFNLGMSYNANMESFKHPSGQMGGRAAACFSSYFTRKRAPNPLKTRMNLSGL